LKKAIKGLTNEGWIRIVAQSSIYESEPWGGVEQPQFWNMVVQIETALAPKVLLQTCQRVEDSLDRKRTVRWGPRTIDIDILFYDNIVSMDQELILPHPHIEEREFVLAPLREIRPNLILPSGGSIHEVFGVGKVRLLQD